MCERCEVKAAEVLADPAKLERFLKSIGADVRCVSNAIVSSSTATANANGMGTIHGAMAVYAACSVLAEQLGKTFGPKTLEVADKMRDELAKIAIVHKLEVAAPGLGVMRYQVPKARA